MISFACPGCGHSLSVKQELSGKRGRCPKCKQSVSVPSAVSAAAITDVPTLAAAGPKSRAATATLGAASSAARDPGTKITVASGPFSELLEFFSPGETADEIGRMGVYRILKTLGQGGMGAVFLAEDPHLKRHVAMKVMLPALAASASARERFLREARAAAAIEHDHVIAILEVAEHRGVPYLVMPLLRGESLEDRLQRDKRLSLSEALHIGRETAEGLAAAHEKGLIHRDIKPANIWLEVRGARGASAFGSDYRVKILDFGLARSEAAQSTLTQQGAIIGTPSYMSPEQASGTVDARADLFSLGVVLYRLTTGILPFNGRDTVGTLIAVATHDPEPPAALESTLRPTVSDFIMYLLAKDPSRRPASARAAATILEVLQRGDIPNSVPKYSRLSGSAPGDHAPGDRRGGARAAKGGRTKGRRTKKLLRLWQTAAIVGVVLICGIVVGRMLLRVRSDGSSAFVDSANDAPAMSAPGGPDDGMRAKKPASANLNESPAGAGPATTTPSRESLASQSHKAALAIFDIGGRSPNIQIQMQADLSMRFVNSVEQLPKQPYVLREVYFGGSEVTDESLAAFQGLKLPDLFHVRIYQARTKGEGLKHLSGAVGLRQLEFMETPLDAAGICQLKVFPNLQSLSLDSITWTGDAMVCLQALKGLKSLTFWRTELPANVVMGLSSLPVLESLTTSVQFGDDGMSALKALPQLKILFLGDTRVTDAGLAYVKDLPSLEAITLTSANVTNKGMGHLKDCVKLRILSLPQQIDDAGVAQLKGLVNLTELFIHGDVTDKGLEIVQGMRSLTSLSLHSTAITDSGLAKLRTLEDLRNLVLYSPNITAVGLRHLRAMPRLSWVSLSSSKIDDQAVDDLIALEKLTFLQLSPQVKISEAGMKKLKEGLRKCQVAR